MPMFSDLPETWPLLLGITLVAVLIAESIYLLNFNARQYRTNVNRRLEIQRTANNREDALLQLKRERGVEAGGEDGVKARLVLLITRSGLTIGVEKVALAWGATALVLPLAVYIAGRTSPLELAGAFCVGLAIPIFVLNMLKAKRIRKFSEQFPDAIDVIVRSLRAGHPLPIAVSLVAREMPDPVGSEFGMVADEITFGLDMETAMRNMYLRVGQEDLPLFVTSISIQAATGGNLAAILESLSKVIRDRFRMRRKIKALSSEAKFSAYVLVSLPFFIFFSVSLTSPDYFDAARGRPETTMVAAASVGWLMIGVAVMRKLVNMKI